MFLDFHLSLQSAGTNHQLSWGMNNALFQAENPDSAGTNHHLSWGIIIILFQAENPHLRIFTLYLLRDPRASLADIKVRWMVWFGLICD